ncbi:MAG TPA: GDP-mannose 4,6-dehydratase [Tepidisphaeraceae bacterium]|nr:GDP-mannose 4,6-dehydratase [Tepidisphaeraceae bacterium]
MVSNGGSKRTVVVTGAAGFIGSHTAQALIGRGYRVIGIDNFCDFYARSWKEENLRAVQREAGRGVELEEMDITDGPRVRRLIETVRPEGIIHLAAMAGVRPSIERPVYYAQVNLEGTTNLLSAAADAKVSKFAFASSSSVYGNNPKVPFAEADDVGEPISPYAATKRAGELLCHTFWHLYKMPVSCLRFFTVYGPRQRPDLAIHKFARLIHWGKTIPVFGDGSTSRDYTFVDDIVAGILAAYDRNAGYRIYNLGGSDPVRLDTLIAGIERAMGKSAVIERRPAQPGDVERTFADVSRSAAELGYAPKVRLQEGLARFAQWLKENIELYRLPGEPEPVRERVLELSIAPDVREGRLRAVG